MEKESSKIYKKYTLVLLILTVAALVISAAALALRRDIHAAQEVAASYYIPNSASSQETAEKPSPSPAVSSASAPKPAASAGPAYLITLSNGKICVFENGRGSPVLTSSADVALLPQEDVAILKAGIWTENLSRARAVLEDYE